MLIGCGYNFCSDSNALTYAPIVEDTFTDTTLTNGIFDHWNVDGDVSKAYSATIPTTWDVLTIMDANFNGNINAGNIEQTNIDSIKIKRRIKDSGFAWVTIDTIQIGGDPTKLTFSLRDNLAKNGVEYEYALVPVIGNTEGNYITNSVGSKFDGVFICDADTVYRFYAGVSYGTMEQVQKIGVFEPYGRKYPVVVANGAISYKTGSFTGTILPNGYLDYNNAIEVYVVGDDYSRGWLSLTEGGIPFVPAVNNIYKIVGPQSSPYVGHYYHWDGSHYTQHETRRLEGMAERLAMVAERDELLDFLTNKRAKILKDWNGNQILMIITGNPTVSFAAGYGMGLMGVNASYTEVGDPNDQTDLFNAGLVTEVV